MIIKRATCPFYCAAVFSDTDTAQVCRIPRERRCEPIRERVRERRDGPVHINAPLGCHPSLYVADEALSNLSDRHKMSRTARGARADADAHVHTHTAQNIKWKRSAAKHP